MEYTLECPEFFLRTETCTGPISRFDAFLLASGRQCLALSGLSVACSARLLARLSGELNRSGIRVQPILSPDFPGKPEALLLDQLLILPDRLPSSPFCSPAPAAAPSPPQPGSTGTGSSAAPPPGSPAPAGADLSGKRRRCPGGVPAGCSARYRPPEAPAPGGTAHRPGAGAGAVRCGAGVLAHRAGSRRTADR